MNSRSLLTLGALALSLALVATLAWLGARQLGSLHTQTDAAERLRLDAVQLLRIQSDLNQLGLVMSDLASDEQRPIAGAAPQFDQIHRDLMNALNQHAALLAASDEQAFLSTPVDQFWKAADIMFALARGGHEHEARMQLQLTLQRQQAGLATTTAYLLLESNEQQREALQASESAASALRQRSMWLLGALVLAIVIAALPIARSRSSQPIGPAGASDSDAHRPSLS
jgi:hypothetical protein